MIKYTRTAFLKFDSKLNGNAFARGPVTINIAGTQTKATLFNDVNGLIPRDNPVKTDENGQYFFYVNNGNYDIFINKGNIGETTILDETIAKPAVIAANEIVINSETDLPLAVAGVITQPDNIVWLIGANLTISDRIVLGDNSLITSNNAFAPVLTYTGTGSMITGNNVDATLKDIRFNCVNAQCINTSSSVGLRSSLVLDTIVVEEAIKFATFDNMFVVDIINCASLEAEDGITLVGNDNWSVFSADKLLFLTDSAAFVGIDFGTSLHTTVIIGRYSINGVPGTIGISGATNSDNLIANALASVTISEFIGGITPISGITLTDVRWDFKSNAGLSDSQVASLISIENNVTETTIDTINTPVKVNGTWITETVSHFIADGTGRVTYIGERSISLPIDITLTLLMASGGGDKQVTGYIAINGTEVSQTAKQGTATNGKAAPLTMIWQHTFSTGDFVEAFVENNSDTINIICQQGVARNK